MIELSVPKFTKKTEIDFIPALSKLGLGKLFNNNFSTTENPFITEKNIKYYMNNIFQKNKIELNEDGTTIKSTSYGSYAYPLSARPTGLIIKLNQPFVFIIRDKNNLPIYVGYMNKPKNN